MSIWKFRAAAVQYLRYERQCMLVAMERGLGSCVPDVVGVTVDRYLIEIEIKRSMSDFRNNAKKWGIQRRNDWKGTAYWLPWQYYFLVESSMVDKVIAEAPESAGVISFPKEFESFRQYGGIPKLVVRKKAKGDKRSEKLPVRAVITMAKHQSGTLSMLCDAYSNHVERRLEQMQAQKKVLTPAVKS